MDIHDDSFQHILGVLNDGLYFVNKKREITFWNEGAERITGYAADEVIGSKCSDNILDHVDEEGRSLCFSICPLGASIKDDVPRNGKVYLRKKNGIRIPVQVKTSALKNEKGEIVGGAEVFTDLIQHETLNQRIEILEKMALADELTNLPNRRYLQEDIIKRIAEFERNGLPLGLLFIDVDHFKAFNDTYGHDTGDLILQTIASTMSASARPFDIFGRWGGEEFVGIVPNINATDLEHMAERLRHLIKNSYIMVEGERCFATVSIGGTVSLKEDSWHELVRRADELMYESKKNGRDRVTVG